MEYSKPIYIYLVLHKQCVLHVAEVFRQSFSQWKWPHPAASLVVSIHQEVTAEEARTWPQGKSSVCQGQLLSKITV